MYSLNFSIAQQASSAFTYFLLFIILSFLTRGALSQTTEPTPEQIDSLFVKWDQSDTPGAAIAIIKDGQVYYKKGYGMANLDHSIPITTSTIFDIASVSKQFGAMAIAMLAQTGEISLDEAVHTYIPEVPDFGAPISIRHLVHHTSGIRDWPGTLAIGGWRMDDIISFDQILRMVWKQQALNFEPGSRYSYSNTGYNLLAETVSRVTDTSFSDWTEEHIFDPLEMHHSHFHDDHRKIVKNRALAYTREGSEYKMIPNGLTALASSSLFTSVDDLAKWVLNFESKEVGGPEVHTLMHTKGVLNNGEEIAYAFGNSVSTYQGLQRVSHSGGWAGFNTYLVRFPEERLAVIVLSNAGDLGAGGRANEIVDLFLKDRFSASQDEDSESPTAVSLEASQLERFVGDYKLGPNWYVAITREGDQLMTQATGEPRFEMIPVSETKFWVPAYGSHIDFKGPASSTSTHFDYRTYQAPRVTKMSNEDLSTGSYLGQFYSEELEMSYAVQDLEGRLVLQNLSHGTIKLRPIVSDIFLTDHWFMGEVEFVRDEDGSVTGFLVSNNRSRNILFQKF